MVVNEKSVVNNDMAYHSLLQYVNDIVINDT